MLVNDSKIPIISLFREKILHSKKYKASVAFILWRLSDSLYSDYVQILNNFMLILLFDEMDQFMIASVCLASFVHVIHKKLDIVYMTPTKSAKWDIYLVTHIIIRFENIYLKNFPFQTKVQKHG